MEDYKKRWSYLCQLLVKQFITCENQAVQKQYFAQLTEREQEIICIHLLTFYMARGGLLRFYSSCNLKQVQIAACAMFKMDVAVVGAVIQEGYQVLEPILQIWQGNTMQDLLCHLTEAEKQKYISAGSVLLADRAKDFFTGLQSLCWITSGSKEYR